MDILTSEAPAGQTGRLYTSTGWVDLVGDTDTETDVLVDVDRWARQADPGSVARLIAALYMALPIAQSITEAA